MLAILISLISGMMIGGISDHQIKYCDCLRSNFEGKVCQDIKSNESQGSCHK